MILPRFISTFTVSLCLASVTFAQSAPTDAGRAPLGAIGPSRAVSLKTIVPNILEDQKQIYWTFPGQVAHGKHWIPVVSVLAATAGLIAADQFDTPYFRRTTAYHGFNNAFSGTNTSLGILIAPLSLYGIGLITKNSYAQSTALLAGEAVADAEILDEVLKLSTRRARPSSIAPRGNFADTWLDSNTITDGGFPSGHTIAAFSVATIFAERYGRHHKWVPYVAYGLAGAVGFSRVGLSAHFPSDVFVGAAFGYAISRFTVLHSMRPRD